MMDVFGQPDLLVAGCVVVAALAFVVHEVVAGRSGPSTTTCGSGPSAAAVAGSAPAPGREETRTQARTAPQQVAYTIAPFYGRPIRTGSFLGPSAKAENAEATGVGLALTPLPDGAVVVAEVAPRSGAGASGRSSYQRRRPRPLSSDQREQVRALSATRSPRELAAEFGVSHETIRGVLGERDCGAAG